MRGFVAVVRIEGTAIEYVTIENDLEEWFCTVAQLAQQLDIAIRQVQIGQHQQAQCRNFGAEVSDDTVTGDGRCH